MTNWLCLAARISLALNFQELLLALTTLKSAFLCFGETGSAIWWFSSGGKTGWFMCKMVLSIRAPDHALVPLGQE